MTINKADIIRYSIVGVMFCCIFNIYGVSSGREAQKIIFMLAMISLFSLLVRNIWVTLFILWTVYLYSFFKFTTGSAYLSNIFFGSILYYLTKISFKKEHINFFIDGFLWFVCLNIVYSVLQVLNYDFIFRQEISILDHGFVTYRENVIPTGFMGHSSIMASLIAFSIPIVASRDSKYSLAVALLLFIPLYIAHTSLCFIVGMIGFVFVVFFKYSKKVSISLLALMIICSVFYVNKVDRIGSERLDQWFVSLKHWYTHPLTGWGLDSYANITKDKDFRYMQSKQLFNYSKNEKDPIVITAITYWDNPHNIFISLLYEFGLIGLIFFVCFIIQNVRSFNRSIKNSNIVGLAGFVLVFLGISVGHFPIFLAREACFIIPFFSLYEVATT